MKNQDKDIICIYQIQFVIVSRVEQIIKLRAKGDEIEVVEAYVPNHPEIESNPYAELLCKILYPDAKIVVYTKYLK